MKNRLGSTITAGVLIAAVVFLSVDVGFSLYNQDRLDSELPICTLNIIGGDVKVQTKNALTWAKADEGMILEPGSRVRTAPDSHASLSFSTGTMTTLEPDTDVIVEKLEDGDDSQPCTVTLKQRSGKTWSQVAKQPENDYSFQIKTSSADIHVHGTLFSTEVDESGKTLVQTTEGLVNVSAQGQAILVPGGQQTEVEAGAVPSIPVPIPPAENELVFTINEPAVGLIISPSGSGTGYLPDGSPLNQISGSSLSSPEEPCQTIRIREPDTGEYVIVMRGAFDGTSSFSVEGFAEGRSTFLHSESCNITAANEMILKLHLDVLDGLLPGAAVLKPEQSEAKPPAVATAQKTPDSNKGIPAESKKEEISAQKASWSHPESDYMLNPWIIVSSVIILFAIIAIVVWRKS